MAISQITANSIASNTITDTNIGAIANTKITGLVTASQIANVANTQITGTITVAQGGTGSQTLTANNVIIGNGAGAVTFVAPGSNGNVLTSNGSTWTSAASSGGGTGTPMINRFHTTSATYTPTANMKFVVVTVTGGGGGSGGGSGAGNAGQAGQASTFGSLITANGGSGGNGGNSQNSQAGNGGNPGNASYGAGATAYQLSTGQNTNAATGSVVYGTGNTPPSAGSAGQNAGESVGNGGNGGQGGFAIALVQATTVGANVAVTVGAGGGQGTPAQGSAGQTGTVRITEFFG